MQSWKRNAAIMWAGLWVGSGALTAAQAGWLDPTMAPGSFTDTRFATSAALGVTVSALSAGGHPGAALQLHYDAAVPVAVSGTQGFIHDGWVHDPALAGALLSLAFTSDRWTDPAADTQAPGLTTFSRPLLQQGGLFYLATLADQQLRGSWITTSAAALTAADFVRYDFSTGQSFGADHPDFSASGAAIGFGFAARFTCCTDPQASAIDLDYRFDNLGYSLDVAAVPEPGMLLLAATGLATLGLAGRRRGPGQARPGL